MSRSMGLRPWKVEWWRRDGRQMRTISFKYRSEAFARAKLFRDAYDAEARVRYRP